MILDLHDTVWKTCPISSTAHLGGLEGADKRAREREGGINAERWGNRESRMRGKEQEKPERGENDQPPRGPVVKQAVTPAELPLCDK